MWCTCQLKINIHISSILVDTLRKVAYQKTQSQNSFLLWGWRIDAASNSSQIFNRVYVCGMFSSWSVAFTCCSCQLTLSKFIFTSFYLLLITYLFVREKAPLKFLHLQFSLFCFLWSLNGNVWLSWWESSFKNGF